MGDGPVAASAHAVRTGTGTAVAQVSEALRRIDRSDGALGAVVALRAEEALAEADALDRALARGARPGPLCGVPVLVKDLEDVAGMPTRKGSVLLADAAPAAADGLVPGRLRAAGAIVVGKSALPEFATEGFTAGELTGITRNPWDTALSPGGSSGGSAAALSAGLVPLATATDGGGSVRIPAAFCGLVGLKPTRGVVPRRPAPDWLDLSTEGPMATTVGDVRLILGVMAGTEPGDAEAWPGRGVPPTAGFPAAGPRRILVAHRTADLGPLPPAVADAFEAAVSLVTGLFGGATVQRWDPADPSYALDTGSDWATLASADHVSALGREWVLARIDRMTPAVQDFLGHGLRVTIDDYLAARRRRFDHVRTLDLLLADDAVLLTPSVAVAAFLADGRLTASDAPGATPSAAYSTELQNITGHPAVSVPAGMCGSLPFGLQVTGPRYSDGWLLDLAETVEAAHPWPRQAPGYPSFAVGRAD
jgi:Asp-tRNA(Asn)/Glu-tRNA(Gln) amidotransferase A subunit family amidase